MKLADNRRLVVVAVVGLAAVLVAVAVVTYGQFASHRTESIIGSYRFDVTDPELVAGYADVVVIARVVAAGETVTTPIVATKFEVAVLEVMMGEIRRTATFVQYGGTRGNVTWVVGDQEVLQPGQTYVLAAGRGEHGFQVVGGPVAVQRLETTGQQAEAVRAWRDHVANRQSPVPDR